MCDCHSPHNLGLHHRLLPEGSCKQLPRETGYPTVFLFLNEYSWWDCLKTHHAHLITGIIKCQSYYSAKTTFQNNCVWVPACTWVCMCASMPACTYAYKCQWIHVCICTCMYVWVPVVACVYPGTHVEASSQLLRNWVFHLGCEAGLSCSGHFLYSSRLAGLQLLAGLPVPTSILP